MGQAASPLEAGITPLCVEANALKDHQWLKSIFYNYIYGNKT